MRSKPKQGLSGGKTQATSRTVTVPNPQKPAEAQQAASREAEMLKEIRETRLDIENLKSSVLSQTNIRTLEHDFLREFQRLSKEVKESAEKNRNAIDKAEAEIRFLREDMARVMSLEEEMSRLNAKSLARDVESLKEKSHWLETSVKGFDMDPRIEKISEMEGKIKILKASQPLIIE